MSERDDLAELFLDIDGVIDWYQKCNAIVERECGYSDGRIKASNSNEYETRRRKIRENYEQRCREFVEQLQAIEMTLPKKLSVEKYLAAPPKFLHRHFVLGELRESYADFRHRSPLVLSLPVSRPICVRENDGRFLLQVMWTLLFTLPPGLCQFHVYDPCHFGNSVDRFDVLLDAEEVFPDKKFLCDDKDFKNL